jgi:hypothetical protein
MTDTVTPQNIDHSSWDILYSLATDLALKVTHRRYLTCHRYFESKLSERIHNNFNECRWKSAIVSVFISDGVPTLWRAVAVHKWTSGRCGVSGSTAFDHRRLSFPFAVLICLLSDRSSNVLVKERRESSVSCRSTLCSRNNRIVSPVEWSRLRPRVPFDPSHAEWQMDARILCRNGVSLRGTLMRET